MFKSLRYLIYLLVIFFIGLLITSLLIDLVPDQNLLEIPLAIQYEK